MICDRVLILNKGRITASDTPENLVRLMKGNPRIVAEVRGTSEQITETCSAIKGIIKVTCEPAGEWCQVICECEKGMDLRAELAGAMSANNLELRELRLEKRKLEDVFIEMTT